MHNIPRYEAAALILHLQAQLELYRCTGDPKYLDEAMRELALAVDYLDCREWYEQLLGQVREQYHRLDEWSP